MYPAEYKVDVYNPIKGKMEYIEGVTMAESFTDAMQIIENYYGDELSKVTITLLEEAEVYEFK